MFSECARPVRRRWSPLQDSSIRKLTWNAEEEWALNSWQMQGYHVITHPQ
jgi:hypothetical protein